MRLAVRRERTMQRSARVASVLLSLMAGAGALASPALAGMTQDLADCTAADRKTSAAACTRVMNSGRLPREQFYIGHYNRGWAHFHQAHYDKALADFDSSVKYNSGYADTYLSRAIIQHVRGARDQSRADLDRYLEKKGKSAEAHLNRAVVFRHRGEPDTAFSELRRAGTLDPDNVKVAAQRAIVLSDLGEAAPAKSEADKAAAADPKSAAAHYARALIAYRTGDLATATAATDTALELKESLPAVHTLKGEIQEKQGEKDAAAASYRRALEISSKSLDAYEAQETARARLKALGGTAPPPEQVAAKAPAPPAPAKVSECRRFIPYAETTVAVDCER